VYALANLRAAFAEVKANGGAAGVDNQTVEMFEVITQSQPQDYQSLEILKEAIPGITVFRPSIEAISLTSLFATQFLILWTADALLLSRSFILALWRDQPLWPAAVLKKEHDALGLDSERATLWLDLRLIGRRSNGVARLVWYPSAVIGSVLLMIAGVGLGAGAALGWLLPATVGRVALGAIAGGASVLALPIVASVLGTGDAGDSVTVKQ
jgi:hypothetical protein